MAGSGGKRNRGTSAQIHFSVKMTHLRQWAFHAAVDTLRRMRTNVTLSFVICVCFLLNDRTEGFLAKRLLSFLFALVSFLGLDTHPAWFQCQTQSANFRFNGKLVKLIFLRTILYYVSPARVFIFDQFQSFFQKLPSHNCVGV